MLCEKTKAERSDAYYAAQAATDLLPDRVMLLVDTLGMSLSEFARSIAVSQGIARQWRDGIKLPKAEQLARICTMHDVDPAWLLLGAGTDPMRAPVFVQGDA